MKNTQTTTDRNENPEATSVGSGALFGGFAHDAGSLKVGERWGAYWKHPDEWMRLYPPTARQLFEDVRKLHSPDEAGANGVVLTDGTSGMVKPNVQDEPRP